MARDLLSLSLGCFVDDMSPHSSIPELENGIDFDLVVHSLLAFLRSIATKTSIFFSNFGKGIF